jgi:hypothetical protein
MQGIKSQHLQVDFHFECSSVTNVSIIKTNVLVLNLVKIKPSLYPKKGLEM